MGFYELSKEKRSNLKSKIKKDIYKELLTDSFKKTRSYSADGDTYIRKAVYLSVGALYVENKGPQTKLISLLKNLLEDADFKIRQTAINAAGEIGKKDFDAIVHFFDRGLFDPHHSPRNAVVGSIKKTGELNPRPVLKWARKYLHHDDKEIRREICHGIELRGRKYPQDILPLLEELQNDKTARVRNTLVHVIGQIAYKKGCLETVVAHLKQWTNKALVADALEEIIDVHDRYRNFAAITQEAARAYISDHF